MKGALESKFATAEARAKEESSAIKDILKSLAGNVDKLSAKVEKLEVKSAALASADSAPPETSKRSLFSTAVAVVAAKKMAMPAKSKNDESTRMTKRPDTKRQAEKEAEEVLDPLMIGDYVVLKSTEGFAKGGLVTGDLSFLRLGKLTCTAPTLCFPTFIMSAPISCHDASLACPFPSFVGRCPKASSV
jgi:NAD-specific glutamate dehydrogenase